MGGRIPCYACGPMAHPDYLERILTARVYDVAIESPLEPAPAISRRLGNHVFLKREDKQPVFSFKLRGAYNKMVHLAPDKLARGVICASAGNHAQGVALAAQRLGCKAVVVMPITTPRIKVAAVAARGATVELHGDSYHEASLHAKALARRRHLTFVHPYDDPLVIAGQGTIGMEILRQHPKPVDVIFVPVGGGGLISGIAAYVKRISPRTRIVGVQPVDSNAMAASLKAGRRVTLAHVNMFADGVAVKQVGRETFRLCRKLVDEMVLVDTDEICAAIKDTFEETRTVVEPAGGLALAGMKRWVARRGVKGRSLVAIACGAEMLYRFEFPERPGALMNFLTHMGSDWNITLFHYRNHGADVGRVLVGLQVPTKGRAAFRRFLRELGYDYADESRNPAYRLFLR